MPLGANRGSPRGGGATTATNKLPRGKFFSKGFRMGCKHEGGVDPCKKTVNSACSVQKAAYYAANKETKIRAYRAANREKIRIQQAAWRAANKEKRRAQSAEYYLVSGRCEHDKSRYQCFACRPKSAVKASKREAEARGFFWRLSNEQAVFIATQPCIYCGKTLANGIDRQNNKYGYTVLNSVPCCGEHNRMKGAMRQKGFILACKAVAAHCVSKEDFVARTNKLQQELKEFEQWQKQP